MLQARRVRKEDLEVEKPFLCSFGNVFVCVLGDMKRDLLQVQGQFGRKVTCPHLSAPDCSRGYFVRFTQLPRPTQFCEKARGFASIVMALVILFRRAV